MLFVVIVLAAIYLYVMNWLVFTKAETGYTFFVGLAPLGSRTQSLVVLRRAHPLLPAPRPLYGPEQVSRLLSVVFRKFMSLGRLEFTTVNGQPGAVFYVDGHPLVTYSVATDGARVHDVYVVLNPEKLALWRE